MSASGDAGKLERYLKSNDLSPSEAITRLRQFRSSPLPIHKHISVPERHVRYGVMSDSHIGHKCYDAGLADRVARTFNREKVDFVVHGGDICEGIYTDRKGHIYELEHITADEQVTRAITELSKIHRPIIGITGNHEQNTFWKLLGFDIGKQLEERLDDFTYLGNADGTIDIAYGRKIQLIHPDGGTAYALSYRPQKIIESIEGGRKPDVLHIAHFHKAEYLFYRNVHAIQNGCLESQTPFMKGKHISAHKGFWIMDVRVGRRGLTQVTPTFYPAYE